MQDIQRIAIFTAVADTLSVSMAAARLGVSNSHVSKQLSALEAELHVRLLHRTTRTISLTEAGAMFHVRCKSILSDIVSAEHEVLRRQDTPQGVLRVTAPANLANARLADIVESFLAEYPQIELDLSLSDRLVDLAEEAIDVALRVVDEIPMNVYARRLARIHWTLVASPSYFEGRRRPQTPEDLPHLDCLINPTLAPRDIWQFSGGGKRSEVALVPRIRCANSEWLRQSALRGLGLAILPNYMIGGDMQHGRLERLLPELEAQPSRWLYGIYLPNRYLSSKVRLFLDAVEQGLSET